ncbi:hypothetical protein DSO57_1011219 [Entomophthora muscae]|uniref:Uncharacterized protein n=1 Tax=Entomophthora muscae TaxID=34485 RepID=A0ACC2RL80_9FUNG|nr:hypothetical protein DSO57_1011219 [Entomophthora muscae]
MKFTALLALAYAPQVFPASAPQVFPIITDYECNSFDDKAHSQYRHNFIVTCDKMSPSNPAIVVKGTLNDGTCLKLYCTGCKDDEIIKTAGIKLWEKSLKNQCSKNMYISADGCVCKLKYSQKASCKKADSQIKDVLKTYKKPSKKQG